MCFCRVRPRGDRFSDFENSTVLQIFCHLITTLMAVHFRRANTSLHQVTYWSLECIQRLRCEDGDAGFVHHCRWDVKPRRQSAHITTSPAGAERLKAPLSWAGAKSSIS